MKNSFTLEDNSAVNKISVNEEDPTKVVFKYDFISMPWDDRTRNSKIGIVALLFAIFLAIFSCIVNNFVMHYQGYGRNNTDDGETSCFRVRSDEYRYVARIYSVMYKGIVCVGAVLSRTSILANGLCVKSGPIRIHLGSPNEPQCKKGLPVNNYDYIYHDGIVSKELVLIKYEDPYRCGNIINISKSYYSHTKFFILGRASTNNDKYLTQHYVSMARFKALNMITSLQMMNINSMICVNDRTQCPVKVGDLLIQNNVLIGLASTSVQSFVNSNIVCFADLKIVRYKLQSLDNKIVIE